VAQGGSRTTASDVLVAASVVAHPVAGHQATRNEGGGGGGPADLQTGLSTSGCLVQGGRGLAYCNTITLGVEAGDFTSALRNLPHIRAVRETASLSTTGFQEDHLDILSQNLQTPNVAFLTSSVHVRYPRHFAMLTYTFRSICVSVSHFLTEAGFISAVYQEAFQEERKERRNEPTGTTSQIFHTDGSMRTVPLTFYSNASCSNIA